VHVRGQHDEHAVFLIDLHLAQHLEEMPPKAVDNRQSQQLSGHKQIIEDG
jgi:hypothetical protein